MTVSQVTKYHIHPVTKLPTRRTEIKSEDGTGQKLYYYDPVCDFCKAKKIACHHRDIYDEFGRLVKRGETPPKLDGPKPASGQAKKAAFKIQIKTFGNGSEKSSETSTASQRPRRANAGKRMLDDVSIESATENDSKRQKTEQKKPGRKPRRSTPISIEDTEAEPLSASSPATEPSVTPLVTQQLRGGNLDNSMDLAWYRGMTSLLEKRINDTTQKWKVLKQTIDQAEEQWEEVQQSMQSTKNFMNEWTSRFARSDAFTL
ncbi:hypothetical protein TMatcc_003155 [Talaromyces marneffei ATCC 18224]|uniref:Uncharacterized protein n=1 Tax=Talaromyces marneffei (strain ATCC 18224 / CBS 334.59 / QM 7333) TaxID=441960 RepID=B6Q5X6_TALMQ|nr:hypothetical protein PMAA_033220 [Talaromyces marneffei ATCC 18224]